MTQNRTRQTALAFFDAYTDPEIEKRLYFDVWADRQGLGLADKRTVWREVQQLTYRFAAQKRKVTHQRKLAARSRFVGMLPRRQAVVSGLE